MSGHIDSTPPFPFDPTNSSDPSAPSRTVSPSGLPSHSETSERPGTSLSAGPSGPRDDAARRGQGVPLRAPGPQYPLSPGAPAREPGAAQPQVRLRGPAELVEALPFLLGFHPDDSVVLIGIHGDHGRFGARLRLALTPDADLWPSLAARAADDLINGAGPVHRPAAVTLFLCQDPAPGETPAALRERLRPLAQHVRLACGALDVPVVEAVCVSAGRWWSYICTGTDCCPPEGTPTLQEGTSVMAAAAAFAGIRVRGTLRELQARLRPRPIDELPDQRRAFDDSSADLVPRMLLNGDTDTVRAETLALTSAALDRFRARPASDDEAGDRHDDALLGDDEAATIVLGLQDREARDRAAEWMEGEDTQPALRLWRALSRRCVGPYTGHAAPPLTLAGWVAWANGDDATARIAFGLALDAEPEYTFARLLHQACAHGLDPEPLRACMRGERGARSARVVRRPSRTGAGSAPRGRADRTTRPPAGRAADRSRTRTRRGDRAGGEETPC